MSKLSAVAIDNTSGVTRSIEVEYDAVDNCGWTKVYIQIPDASQYDGSYCYEVSAKVDDVGSTNGINNGRISKLCVKDVNSGTANEVIGYDRGWYLKPQCPQDTAALGAILTIFGHC